MGEHRDNRPALERPRFVLLCAALVAAAGAILCVARGWSPASALLLHLAVLSILTFVWFWMDKRRARTGGRRVSERNLLLAALLGGAAGGLVGMLLLRHKSRRREFRLVLPALLLIQIAAVLWLAFRSG